MVVDLQPQEQPQGQSQQQYQQQEQQQQQQPQQQQSRRQQQYVVPPKPAAGVAVRVIGPSAAVDSARLLLSVVLEYMDREREMREGDAAVRERLQVRYCLMSSASLLSRFAMSLWMWGNPVVDVVQTLRDFDHASISFGHTAKDGGRTQARFVVKIVGGVA